MATGGYIKTPVTLERVTMAEHHPEIVTPEPILRQIVRDELDRGAGPVEVRVFIGDQEVKDMVPASKSPRTAGARSPPSNTQHGPCDGPPAD